MAAAVPSLGYVICTEHRSGSNFLCDLLASTGELGRPREYFSDKSPYRDIERNPDMLARLLEEATTPNGVYGLKLFTHQFDLTRATRWPERLPNLRFILLDRRDLLGQAISYVRANQTRQYRTSDTPHGEPRYDGKEIARHIARIAESQARWRRYFARNDITPLCMAYEDLAANPQDAVIAVARHIGIGGGVAIDEASIRLRVQRDSLSEEWRQRFVAEARDLNRLDHALGDCRVRLRRLVRDLRLLFARASSTSQP
jgi:LPS sulfotransferase NodH